MQDQLNSIETKITDLHNLLNAFMLKQETRVTRLETVQRAVLWVSGLLGTALFSTAVINYMVTFFSHL